MADKTVDKITALLSSDAVEKRIAAAIVLGELKARGPRVVQGLTAALEHGGPTLQRHALDALARISAKRSLTQVMVLLASRDKGVRAAAVEAVAAMGESALPKVKQRLADTTSAEERRALDAVLARLGGKQAFTTLLAGLEDADEEQANAAAVAMRGQVRDADGKLRRSYLLHLEKVISQQGKRKGAAGVAVLRAALKMLGYLEDARALPTLQKHAASKKHPASVRQEALIALRFTMKDDKPDAKTLNALISAAAADDRTLAQTALITLSGMGLPARAAGKLDPLIAHPDVERAKLVIDMLAHRQTQDSAAQLVQVIAEHDMRKAKLAASALASRKDAIPALVIALATSSERERGRLLFKVLYPWAGDLSAAQRRKLLGAVATRLEKGEQGWQSAFDIADAASPKDAAKMLRGVFDKIKRRKPPERATNVLRLLTRIGQATHDDRYQLASRLLATSHKDTSPTARRGDDALRELARLLREGYDIVKALRKDRSVGLEELYYLGFHFIEEGHPAGEDLLQQVVAKGGRKKIAKMAKNKLALAA